MANCEERLALLRLAAQGRRAYIYGSPESTKHQLEAEAAMLELAARIMEGDDSPLYSVIPSWMWTDKMNEDLNARMDSSDQEL